MYNQSYIACNRVLLYDDFAIYQDRSSLDMGRCLLCNFVQVTNKIRESWQICVPKLEYARPFCKCNIVDVNWLLRRHNKNDLILLVMMSAMRELIISDTAINQIWRRTSILRQHIWLKRKLAIFSQKFFYTCLEFVVLIRFRRDGENKPFLFFTHMNIYYNCNFHNVPCKSVHKKDGCICPRCILWYKKVPILSSLVNWNSCLRIK